jgi:catechol 2,3-dioxygenase-like lactoylglutathione lyase family enzyme
MLKITKIGRVMIPVSNQDEAIEFYTKTLGFSLVADVPFGAGERWVEVAPPGGGANLALVPPQGAFQPGQMTGIALMSPDPRSDYTELKNKDVDVDAELMGGDGGVPLLFFFRDNNSNHLMVVAEQ